MNFLKAFFGASVITLISCALLSLTKGAPTPEQLLVKGGTMFAVALVVLLFYPNK